MGCRRSNLEATYQHVGRRCDFNFLKNFVPTILLSLVYLTTMASFPASRARSTHLFRFITKGLTLDLMARERSNRRCNLPFKINSSVSFILYLVSTSSKLSEQMHLLLCFHRTVSGYIDKKVAKAHF